MWLSIKSFYRIKFKIYFLWWNEVLCVILGRVWIMIKIGLWSLWRKELKMGESTCFWHDTWLGENRLSLSPSFSLSLVFPQLFLLSIQKNEKVNQMRRRIDEEWNWDFHWRREPFHLRRRINVYWCVKLQMSSRLIPYM